MTSSSADAEGFSACTLVESADQLIFIKKMTQVQLRYIKAQAKRAARKEKEMQRDEVYIRRMNADIY